jgi:hypothetical protein
MCDRIVAIHPVSSCSDIQYQAKNTAKLRIYTEKIQGAPSSK